MQRLCIDVRTKAVQSRAAITPFQLVGRLVDAILPHIDGASPEQFGPEYGWGHPSLEQPDLPHIVDSVGWRLPNAPNTWLLAGSTGVVNIGVSSYGNSKQITIKHKYMVSANAVKCAMGVGGMSCGDSLMLFSC
jgi:hypothetical protein